ncbi:EamA domain [Dillenia turbinata]|uniref:WAT1-related protein n=1 Tax=Dillenia turbinata TaxID=194707 RepID=A0AAN8UMM1_9MAGN
MAGRYCYRVVLPVTAMLILRCALVGGATLFKAANNKGLSYYAFVVYYHGLATLLLLFSPFVFNSRSGLPPLNICILRKIFLLGALGATTMILAFKGISYSSPTLHSAISNLNPGFTFILAVIFRMETVKLRSSSSWAKIIGTIVSICGAILVILYKGPPIILTKLQSTLTYTPLESSKSNWIIGGLLIAEQVLLPVSYILQAQVLKEYPSELVVTFFNNLFMTLLAGVFGLLAEPNPDAWTCLPDIALAAILYFGIVVAVFVNAGFAWVIHLKGPLFLSSFTPMNIIIAIAMGVIFLGDTPHLGSFIGATIITAGFYTVLWGKANEGVVESCKESLEVSSSQKTPFLENPSIDA